ncbi:hypothetical protein [Sporomusa malonica]|uniref:Uncharacterized protein n=1 Tax=Sporomusa malonica TaxID=112901 RepID=A0A1W2F034_9FIRM|nr:hypothetical protein [Sporomusa malonica]SMD15295.1 hypothetical protein SAMN04488500_1379 [Sporomusa malonica]
MMSNQAILWSTIIIPWLSLFLMPRKDVKRFMPAGLFTTFLSVIVSEVGVANGWWYFRETTYPLAIFSSFTYGLYHSLYFIKQVIANRRIPYIQLFYLLSPSTCSSPVHQ